MWAILQNIIFLFFYSIIIVAGNWKLRNHKAERTLEGQTSLTTLKMRKVNPEGVNNLLQLPVAQPTRLGLQVLVPLILPFHTALGGTFNVQHQE